MKSILILLKSYYLW